MSPIPSLAAYVAEIARIYSGGMATEHSYRSAIMGLVRTLAPSLVATNEPKRIECGSPDIILTEKDVPVGYIETKVPFDDDLEGRAANKEQFDRYLASLDKIVFTDFLRFRFYEHGEFKSEIVLGRMSNEIKKKWKAVFRGGDGAILELLPRRLPACAEVAQGPQGKSAFAVRRHPLRPNPPRPRPHRRTHGGNRRHTSTLRPKVYEYGFLK